MKKVNPRNILLVEDNPGDIELIKEAFEEADFDSRLFVTQDGKQALDFLYQKSNYPDAVKPDLILLDLNLPETDGREVLQTLKNDSDLKSIPVSVFTSSKAMKDKADCYDLHANCYVVKPVDVMDYISTVQNIGRFWTDLVTLPRLRSY